MAKKRPPALAKGLTAPHAEAGIGGFPAYRFEPRRSEKRPPPEMDSPSTCEKRAASKSLNERFGELPRRLEVGGRYFRDQDGEPHVWCEVPGQVPIYDALRIESPEFAVAWRAAGLPEAQIEMYRHMVLASLAAHDNAGKPAAFGKFPSSGTRRVNAVRPRAVRAEVPSTAPEQVLLQRHVRTAWRARHLLIDMIDKHRNVIWIGD